MSAKQSLVLAAYVVFSGHCKEPWKVSPWRGHVGSLVLHNFGEKDGDDLSGTLQRASDEFLKGSREVVREANPVYMSDEFKEEVRGDVTLAHDTFMPGYELDWRELVAPTACFLLSLAWLVFYFGSLIKSDRHPCDAPEHAQNVDKYLQESQATMLFGLLNQDKFLKKNLMIDLVLVFHHPQEPDSALDQILTPRSHETANQRVFISAADQYRRSRALLADPDTEMKTLRTALLQDLYGSLAKHGFDALIFPSVDTDELFVCIGLQRQDCLDNYLQAHGYQFHLQKEVIERLGVGACSNEEAAATPWVPYDLAIVRRLAEKKVIKRADPKYLYVTHHGHGKQDKQSLVCGQERVRIIFEQLTKDINLDLAVQKQLLVDWFPAHRLSNLQRIAASWVTRTHLFDFSFQQPIRLICHYFGSRVAFIFEWIGFYCKALLALLPIALIWDIIPRTVGYFFTGVASSHDTGILALSLVVITWAKIASNLWNREQAFFLKLWNIDPEHHEGIVRPSFDGQWQPSRYDAKVKDLQAPRLRQAYRQAVSNLICFVAICFVTVAIFMWVSHFDGRMNLFAGVMLSVQIKVFEILFNSLSVWMTNWENHKFQVEYFNNLLWKQFLFGFVNNYWVFLYLAFKQRHTEAGCPMNDCMLLMRRQLVIVMLILALARIGEVIGNAVLVRLKIWLEDRKLQAKLGGRPLPKRAFTEEQAKSGEFRSEDQIQTMLYSVIPLGYVILFGGVAPITIPLALIVFIVQLRTGSFMLVALTKRPLPRRSPGIGAWQQIVYLMMMLAVGVTAFLWVTYGHHMKRQSIVTKMSACLCFFMLVGAIWLVVDIIVPSKSLTVEIMIERQKLILERMAKALADAERKNAKKASEKESSSFQNEFESEVAGQQWQSILPLEDREGDLCLVSDDDTQDEEC